MTISNLSRFAAGLALALSLLAAAPASAGPGHGHSHGPVSKEQILPAGISVKERLIKEGKIDANWSQVAPEGAEQVDGNGRKEWLVTFKNPAATDKTKERLHVFFTLDGFFVAANFTGK